jgi:type VI protein secretion system component VasF
MKRSDELLKQLLRTAHAPRVEPPAEAPFGFSTRVAARWAGQSRAVSQLRLWERLCQRVAVGLAVMTLVVGLAVWQSWLPVEHDEDSALITQLNELSLEP